MSHDTQEDRRSSSVAVKPPTHTRAGHGDADAAEGAERSRQSRALRGDRLPSAELERAALGTGGKSSDRRLSPCGAAGSPPAPPPSFLSSLFDAILFVCSVRAYCVPGSGDEWCPSQSLPCPRSRSACSVKGSEAGGPRTGASETG